VKGSRDAVTCELGLTRDLQPEKATAADHKKIHEATVVRPAEAAVVRTLSDP
jgi:hypothetical protein